MKGIEQMKEKRTRRTFNEEFKGQIVQLYNHGKRVPDICREYDLKTSTVWRWIERVNKTGSTLEKDNRTPEQQKIIDQEKELKQLRMEVDILKQAALIFAQK